MAASASPLKVKRIDLEITDGMVVYLPCAVQMFSFSKAGRPVFDKLLAKGSKVTLKLKETRDAIAKGFKFYYVQQGTSSGYISKAAFHDFVIAKLKDTPYTGVTYGGDKWMTDGKGNLLSFPVDDDHYQPCDLCGAKINDHKLYETKELATMLTAMIKLLGTSVGKGWFKHDKFMLGGLRTKENSFILAYSGKMNGADLGEFKACAADLEQHPVVAEPISGLSYRNDVDQSTTTSDLSSWSCAAPRAVQCAWKMHEIPLELSEKWFGTEMGVAIQGHSVKSCDTCRERLPGMLCGLAFMRL